MANKREGLQDKLAKDARILGGLMRSKEEIEKDLAEDAEQEAVENKSNSSLSTDIGDDTKNGNENEFEQNSPTGIGEKKNAQKSRGEVIEKPTSIAPNETASIKKIFDTQGSKGSKLFEGEGYEVEKISDTDGLTEEQIREKRCMSYKEPIRRTFALDSITVEALRILSFRWRVSQSAAIQAMAERDIPKSVWVEARRNIIRDENTPVDYLDDLDEFTVDDVYYHKKKED